MSTHPGTPSRRRSGPRAVVPDRRWKLACKLGPWPPFHSPFLSLDGAFVAVASMGGIGFQSKAMRSNAWQHPAPEVIRWLGCSHRVFHTLIHEKRFRWDDLQTMHDHERMHEYSHILIETDGTWFRVVELPIDSPNLRDPPTVEETRRGNGTRWIRAR